ncbi:MAG: hypothetical protein VB093_07440 [Propionicimonas sp.]|nr:hypothetical protein [Propionicimonas sp.]
MIIQPTFYIPPDIAAGLLSGEFIRYGGVVRDTAGRLVTHLKEVSIPKPSEEAAAAAFSLLRKPVVLITTAVVGVVAAGVAAVVVVSGRRKRAMPECVKSYTESLHTYLEAVRSKHLDAEIIDRLIADLDAVKEYSETAKITVDFTTEQSETLVRLVVDYTRQLAAANAVELNEPQDQAPVSGDGVVVNLRHYLEVQRRIFNEAA